jgi:hypothetical protein
MDASSEMRAHVLLACLEYNIFDRPEIPFEGLPHPLVLVLVVVVVTVTLTMKMMKMKMKMMMMIRTSFTGPKVPQGPKVPILFLHRL